MSPEKSSEPSLLDEVKLQARVLVPVLRALRAELGAAKAEKLVGDALREWSREVYRRVGEENGGGPRARFDAIWADLRPRIGATIDREMLTDTPAVREYNVTRCGYADFFKELGEPELGRMLLCEIDFDIAEVGVGDVEFKRTQTIMGGAAWCDFRYRLKNGPA